jgi:hypothetical protein
MSQRRIFTSWRSELLTVTKKANDFIASYVEVVTLRVGMFTHVICGVSFSANLRRLCKNKRVITVLS